MSTADVTVLMPVYNAEKYLSEAIESVLNQTYREFEFLIVNDGSTDKSQAIVESYSDPRIKLITKVNGGVSSALNAGLSEATGKFIVRFDADDICYPNRIEEQYLFMKDNPDYILAGTDADYITKEGDYIFTFVNSGHSDPEIKKNYLESCPFIHSTVIYRKDAVLALGGYEVKAHTFEDYFLWVRLIERGKVCNFNKPLVKVRFNPESVTVDNRDYNATFKKIHRKALQTSIITAEEETELIKSIKKLDKKKKEFSYNRMLAKKYLWNNYKPQKAREHIKNVLRINPLDPTSYFLLLLSYLPEKIVTSIYSKIK